MTVCSRGWSFAWSVVLLVGEVSAQASPPADVEPVDSAPSLPDPHWSDLTLISSGLVLLIPRDWERTGSGSWQFGEDRRFMVGWAPAEAGGAAVLGDGMQANVESTNPVSDVHLETVSGAGGELLARDLIGTSTDADGKDHWQWTRLVLQEDGTVVLLAVLGDFADASRIYETREQMALTLSSLLNVVTRRDDGDGFTVSNSTERLTLGSVGHWAMIAQFWASPKIHAEPHADEAARELIFQIVDYEQDAEKSESRNPRVRRVRHRFVDGVGGAGSCVSSGSSR